MGWTEAEIQREVRKVFEQMRLAGESEVDVAWVTAKVMAEHATDVHGDDADFALCAANYGVKDFARRFGRRKPGRGAESAPVEQLVFDGDGFEHLQEAYNIERDGRYLNVERDAMTDAELLAKAAEIEDMGKGCFAHAAEIRRYVEIRSAGMASA